MLKLENHDSQWEHGIIANVKIDDSLLPILTVNSVIA